MKRLFAMLLAAAMCAGLICAPASAAAVEDSVISTAASVPGGEIVPLYVPGEPDIESIINLGTRDDSRPLENLHVNEQVCSYNYYITPSGRINLRFTLQQSGDGTNFNRKLEVKVYRFAYAYDDGWNPHPATAYVKSQTLTFSTSSQLVRNMTITGLSTTERYFLVFKNVSTTGEGWITGNVTITR